MGGGLFQSIGELLKSFGGLIKGLLPFLVIGSFLSFFHGCFCPLGGILNLCRCCVCIASQLPLGIIGDRCCVGEINQCLECFLRGFGSFLLLFGKFLSRFVGRILS